MRKDWAALFDWDGVIIDSAAQHEKSWERLAQHEKLPLPPGHFKRGFGMKNDRIIPDILNWTHNDVEIRRLSLRKEEFYREILKETGLQALPGVELWLEQLHQAHVPCAIGSSTHLANIQASLNLIGLKKYFSAIVTAEDVEHGKPHPDVFLKAAQKLNMDAARCVVFEDAQVGIQAARNAGMKVIGVATTHPAASLKNADLIVEKLNELRLEQIRDWFVSKSVRLSSI